MNNLENDELNPLRSTKLFGLNEHLNILTKLYDNKKLPNVILLEGEKGLGKFTLSFHLINYILSINTANQYNVDDSEIKINSIIYKNIIANSHENFFYLGNENEKKRTSIDDVRNIKIKFSKTLLNDLPRFTIIDDVELLNLNAANALLKLIEEPSKNNYFIMIDNKKSNIIQTLKSRSLIFKIFLNDIEKKNILNKLIAYKKIEPIFLPEYIRYSTPGNILNFFNIFQRLKLNIELPLMDITLSLLNDYKKNKNSINLDCINFILNVIFLKKKEMNQKNLSELIKIKLKIINLLNQYRIYNLSNNTILEYIKLYPSYAK